MKRSTDRILTTHSGSLPRSPGLAQAMAQRDKDQLTPAEAERSGCRRRSAMRWPGWCGGRSRSGSTSC